jgi:hypothetical protein
MQRTALLIGLALLTGCASEAPQTQAPGVPAPEPLRAVHSGERDRIDFWVAVDPNCEIEGYPEISVVKAPGNGTVSTEKGQNYPNFPVDNVRHDCNRKLVGSTQVFYQSNAGFHGKDALTIRIRFPDSHVMTAGYAIEVN